MNIGYRGIDLSIVHTRSILREAIETQDETTLLYQKWTIDVDCVYNPQATSFDQASGVVGSFGVALPGAFPPETDAAIRQTLLQPQGSLIMRDEDQRLILRSPLPGYSIDAKNGPFPQVCEVARIHGTKTWNVHFKIVTYVNECPKVPGPYRTGTGTAPAGRNALLSHRWKRYVDVDEDYFSTVVTQGTCIFRADELVRLGQFPDQFRQQLFHAIPANFRRDHIHVAASEDGTSVDYSVTDRELHFNFLDPSLANGTRIEASQTGGYSEPNIIAVGVSGAARALSHASLIDPVLGAARAAREVFLTTLNKLPSYSMHVICRVWGNRNSSRLALMNTAIGVCMARLGGNILQVLGRSSETLITQSLTEKYVEVQMTAKWGPEQAAIALAGATAQAIGSLPGAVVTVAQFFSGQTGQAAVAAAQAALAAGTPPPTLPISNPTGFDGILSFFPANENITLPGGVGPVGPVPPAIAITQNPLVVNYPPPNSGGSRGTWVGRLVAAALAAPCTIPARPPILPPPPPIGPPPPPPPVPPPPPPPAINDPTIDLNLY